MEIIKYPSLKKEAYRIIVQLLQNISAPCTVHVEKHANAQSYFFMPLEKVAHKLSLTEKLHWHNICAHPTPMHLNSG